MELSKEQMKELYTTMRRIRRFELEVSKQFKKGVVQGFVHLYLGQEAIATGVCSNLKNEDYITSTHRGHGHLIAKGASTKRMMAELCGRETGYCKGKGGSMHIAAADLGILGANGIVGGGFAIAAGGGLSAQMRGTDQVTVCFFGEGATNEGTFHEAMNIASVWKLPVVFVCENNLYGMFTDSRKMLPIVDVSVRAGAYGMPGVTAYGNDVIKVREISAEAIDRARAGDGPTLIEFKTYKHHGHFEGDPARYRPKEEVEEWLAQDPLPLFEAYLKENGIFTEEEIKDMFDSIDKEVEEALAYALDSPFPDPASAVEDVYTDIIEEGR